METKRVYTFGNGKAEGKADMRNLLCRNESYWRSGSSRLHHNNRCM